MPNRFLKYWMPLYLYAGVIFYMSGVSRPAPALNLPFFDKALHIAEYALFGFLASRAFINSSKKTLSENFIVIGMLASAVYGFSDELHQYFVPGRECSAFDLLADTIGGIIGALVYGRYRPV